MKNMLTFGLAIVFFATIFIGCSNGSGAPEITTQQAIPETTIFRTTVSTETTLEDVSLSFPVEFTVRPWEEDGFPFQRHYRTSYYGLRLADQINSVSREALNEWIDNYPNRAEEAGEPRELSFIKFFDVSFEEFRNAVASRYLLWRELGTNMNHEEFELPNPYLLFTFNLERINDYYSLDPARHTSARLWLEEWLQHNEPYASYSAFRAANP